MDRGEEMQLIKVEVSNFKSVKESNEFSVHRDTPIPNGPGYPSRRPGYSRRTRQRWHRGAPSAACPDTRRISPQTEHLSLGARVFS